MTKLIYEQMKAGVFAHPNYRCVSPPEYSYYMLIPRPSSSVLQGGQAPHPERLSGWKFHLSVGAKDVPRAWDIAADKMMTCGFACEGKVGKLDVIKIFADPRNIRAGKHITIYTRENIEPTRYKSLLQDIESAFESAGISRGPASNTDRAVPGSAFISYRNDRSPSGEKVHNDKLGALSKKSRYNPYDIEDPYRDFRMQPMSEPRKTWSKALAGDVGNAGHKTGVHDHRPDEGKLHRALSWFLGRSP